jgi:hypothetical protein
MDSDVGSAVGMGGGEATMVGCSSITADEQPTKAAITTPKRSSFFML